MTKPRVDNYFVTPGVAASGRIVKGAAHTKTVAHTVSGQIAKPNGTGGVKGTGSLGKAKGKVGSKAKAKVGAPHPKSTAAGQEPGPAFRMDGRSERAVKAVKADLQIVTDALGAITFNESFEGLLLTGEALKAFMQELSKKQQEVALRTKTIVGCKQKIDRSQCQDVFEEN